MKLSERMSASQDIHDAGLFRQTTANGTKVEYFFVEAIRAWRITLLWEVKGKVMTHSSPILVGAEHVGMPGQLDEKKFAKFVNFMEQDIVGPSGGSRAD